MNFISGGGKGEALTILQKARSMSKNGTNTTIRNVAGTNPLPDTPVGKGTLFG